MSKRFMYLVAGIGIGWFTKSAYEKSKQPVALQQAGTQQVASGGSSFFKGVGVRLAAAVAAPFVIEAVRRK